MEPNPHAFKGGEEEQQQEQETILIGTVPGTLCTVISAATLKEMLAQPTERGKKTNLEPLKSMNLGVGMVAHNHSSGAAEVHMDWDDVWEGIDGEMIFVLGGQLDPETKSEVVPGELRAQRIIGNKAIVVLGPGDQLIIPAGTPHQNMCLNGMAKALIIKRLRKSLLDEVAKPMEQPIRFLMELNDITPC